MPNGLRHDGPRPYWNTRYRRKVLEYGIVRELCGNLGHEEAGQLPEVVETAGRAVGI